MRTLALALAAGLALGACDQDPAAKQARAIERSADARADAIKENAEQKARQFESRAEALAERAEAAGGYTGEQLEARAESLDKQAQIINRQGDELAGAVEDAGEARADAVRAR